MRRGKRLRFGDTYVSSHRRTNVFEHLGLGHGILSVCPSGRPLAFLLRRTGFGLRGSELLDCSTAVKVSVCSRLQSKNECGEDGNDGLAREMLAMVLLAKAL